MELFGFFFQQTSRKLFYLFGRSSHSVCPFHEEDIPFFSKEDVSLCLYFTHVERVFFRTPYFAATSLFVIPISESIKALHFTPIGLLFNFRFMGTIFLSRRTTFMFSKIDCMIWKRLNSSQKVRILLKKLGEIKKRSSYREKFIQGTNKFVRPTEMFEFSCIQVIEIFFAWKVLVDSRDQQICST